MNTSPEAKTPDTPTLNTLEDMRMHLEDIHETPLAPNDPILMAYTLYRASLNDYEGMLKRHHKAITLVMNTAVEGLSHDDISKNLLAQNQILKRTQDIYDRQYKRAKILSILNLSIFCIFALVLIYLFIQ
ncbi:MAG: hypothetical protein COB46_14220 [Rhodospirillaceae bacterium]|nr:MAG: hypothetical protein COB46_14220 [Rhodospirillaceae bacterium]